MGASNPRASDVPVFGNQANYTGVLKESTTDSCQELLKREGRERRCCCMPRATTENVEAKPLPPGPQASRSDQDLRIFVHGPWSVAFITTAVGDQGISDVNEGGVFR